ncbi:DeoR/GlpR family DNA-binding transcription regulator [uncultured Jatrophihabitans sp.]|uniref:DeoR/GlpR family DNA-binding transcription regulator n=1 Tax=uncultured Jatrophihabitans sp. TaxID=1610747 RepID=UPI0035CA1BD7
MLVPDRQRGVLDHVRRRGSARIEELAAQFGVSPWTVRRDLEHLERAGLLTRTRGGALVGAGIGADVFAGVAVAGDESADPARGDAKRRIGWRAAQFVEDDATIMVLAGSTTAAMVSHLTTRRLTVVTNGLEIANELKHAADVSVVVLGGMLHRTQMALVGALAEAAMAGLHVDAVVGGAYGIDVEVGITGAKIATVGHHRGILSHADTLIVLADSSKLGRRGPTVFAGLDQVDRVITDTEADADLVAQIRARGPVVDLV